MIPYATKASSFMRDMSDLYPRELAGRMIIGAFNRFRAKDEKEIAFLEDISCDEMYSYAAHVTELLQSTRSLGMSCVQPRRNNHRQSNVFDMCWDGVTVKLHAVHLNTCTGYGAEREPSVVAFAFCRDMSSVPFALTGMRHSAYKHIPDHKLSVPSTDDAVIRMKEEHCPTPAPDVRKSIVQKLGDSVSPVTSNLNPRQRFTMQQSFIVQACAMHGTELRPHKKMLRQLVMDWYNHRVNAHRFGKQASTESSSNETVTDVDICFMLAANHTLRREINPHWWFAKSIV